MTAPPKKRYYSPTPWSKTDKRHLPLDGIPLNTQNYHETFHLQLYRVVLLVNGLARPALLYKNQE